MFSGIVETVAPILGIRDSVYSIRTPRGWKLGDGESVSVDGVCSTVQKIAQGKFSVVYMEESLRRTTLGSLRPGDSVNLERSLRLNSLLSGHLVQGHVDAVAKIQNVRAEGDAKIYRFALPSGYARYLVEKGSVALDGISLTVVEAHPRWFTISLLSYTLSRTTLGRKGPGDSVNLEVDVIAKYVEKLLGK